MSNDDDDIMISETWPRRRRCALDDAMLTIAGAATWLESSRGSLNGLYDPAASIVREGAYESFSQRRDREAARAMRLQWGGESWQTVVTAYAEERLREIEAENVIYAKRKATDNAET